MAESHIGPNTGRKTRKDGPEMDQKTTNCWICTGKGKNLCSRHFAQSNERASTYNISRDEAIWQIRQEVADEQSERSGPETRGFVDADYFFDDHDDYLSGIAHCDPFNTVPDRRDLEPVVVIYRVRLIDLHVDVMKPEDAVLEIAGFSSSAEYPSVMDIAAALASDKVFRSKQCVYAMDIDEALGAALIPVALVLDPFTTRIMDFLMNPARKGGRA